MLPRPAAAAVTSAAPTVVHILKSTVNMGEWMWWAVDWVFTLLGLVIGIMWVSTILTPRKNAEGMGWTVPQAFGMTALFTLLWLGGYMICYAIARFFGAAG